MRFDHRRAPGAFLTGLLMLPVGANAADAINGERVAKSRCVACHIIGGPDQHREVADALPFEVIARKFGFDSNMLVFELRERHPKMNFVLTRSEANDIAAYMSTLAR